MSERTAKVTNQAVRIELDPALYLGEPGHAVVARIAGRIGPGGLVGTYCDCSTCACGSCACNCSCNACGACYCDCSCSQLELVWREENLATLASVLEALKLQLGDVHRIAEVIGKR